MRLPARVPRASASPEHRASAVWLSKDTSVQELNDIVIEEYRRALLERQKSA
jgi:hypothetical protein